MLSTIPNWGDTNYTSHNNAFLHRFRRCIEGIPMSTGEPRTLHIRVDFDRLSMSSFGKPIPEQEPILKRQCPRILQYEVSIQRGLLKNSAEGQ